MALRRTVGQLDRKDVERWAAMQMSRYPECKGWTFKWSNAHSTLGLTVFAKRELQVSTFVLVDNPWSTIRDVVLHEIAHILAGPSHGHDGFWKSKCAVTGATPIRCGAAADRDYWNGSCTKCPATFQRVRKPRASAACGRCHSPIRWSGVL